MPRFYSVVTLSLLVEVAFAAPTSIWAISIWEAPAPPPDQGPPLSAHALRNKSKLKYEVIGIVGAYIVWASLSFLLLLFIGKRLRRKAQTSLRTLNMELVKPGPTVNQAALGTGPSPTSPKKPWASPTVTLKSWKGPKHAYKESLNSVSTFDESIIEQDRSKNADEMERLYAAVMAHDSKKSTPQPRQHAGFGRSPLASPASNTTFETATARSPPYSATFGREPMRSPDSAPQEALRSPGFAPQEVLRSPGFAPQDALRSPGFAPQQGLRSPGFAPPEFQHLRNDHNSNNIGAALEYPPPLITPDDYSRVPTASTGSSKMTKAVAFMSPAHSRGTSANSNKSRPSAISIRGLPISPPIVSPELRSSVYSDDASMTSRVYTPGPPPLTPMQKSAAAQARESERKPSMRAPAPAPLPIQTSAANSSRSLPFREHFPTPPQSAPPTKVTYLEKRNSILHPAPKTGVPSTPYSAYQPFTPMTPITPGRLVTKEERKRQRKQAGVKVLSDDDVVRSDEDMWQ